MPRTYKPVPECPPKLARIMKAANILPDDTNEMFAKMDVFIAEHNSKNLSEFSNDDFRDKGSNEYWDYQKTLFQHFESIIANKSLSKWLIGKTDIFRLDVVLRFAALVEAKKVLRYIAETNRDEDSQRKRLERYYALTPKGNLPFIKQFYYYNYREEKLDFKPFDYLDFFALLIKLKGSLKRIKLCPICDGVFWAKKTNALTCGNKKCIDGLQYQKKKENKLKQEIIKLARFIKRRENNGTV